MTESNIISEGPLVPPAGTWFHATADEWEIGATTQNADARFLVPFACIFLASLISGVDAVGYFKGVWTIHHTTNFLSPLFIGKICMVSIVCPIALMSICGKVRVRVRGDVATAFAGVGTIGWQRRFTWTEIREIRFGNADTQWKYGGKQSTGIQLLGSGKPINFGTLVNPQRQTFLINAMRKMLAAPRN